MPPTVFAHVRSTVHRDADDLLTAGLGLAGLRAAAPPAIADPARPTSAELRRRAVWTNWRGIADLSVSGAGPDVAPVTGLERHALATVPGATRPHRVMVQVPDTFDPARPCIVVSAASGSRGIYGAIAVASAWGLPRGCAVACTDKGAGTDYVDLDAGSGTGIDGRVVTDPADAAFAVDAPGVGGIAIKHAHSGDNPEADWGRHVHQAAEFALEVLADAFPDAGPFDPRTTRIIAVGLSNGGGAVLRAAELEGDWLDAVVAGAPSVDTDGAGARSLYDYATEAALLLPCALHAVDDLPMSLPALQAAARGKSLRAAGWVEGGDLDAQARSARARLEAGGWTARALRAAAIPLAFDLWRAIAVTYASAYGRYAVDAHPCGYRFSALREDGTPRPARPDARASWWAEATGLPPGTGVGIVDPLATGPDPAWPGLRALRGLVDGGGVDGARVRTGIAEIRCRPPAAGVPVVIVHGVDDGLIPMRFTSSPYVAAARTAGRDVRFRQVAGVQHFDSARALPGVAARYAALLPHVFAALDQVWAHLEGQGPLPADAVIEGRP